MNLRLKMALGVGASLVGCLFSATPSAAATTGVGVAVGSGTISPGLTAAGGSQTVTWFATMVVASTSTTSNVTFTCSSSDTNDTIGTYAFSSGIGTMTCYGSQGASSGPYAYTRDGVITIMNGAFTSGPLAVHNWAARCMFLFTFAQTNGTINGYEMQCNFALAAI